MQKKILSLILSGILFSQVSCIGTFTVGTFGISNEPPPYSDICKGFPKNQYNQTMDVYCAFKQLANGQKIIEGHSPGIIRHIGLEGENEIRFWHVDHLRYLARELYHIIFNRNKETLKNEYIKNLSDMTSNFLPQDSAEEAYRVNKKLLSKSLLYFSNKEMTTDEFEEYEDNLEPITEREIDLWKWQYQDLLKEYMIENCNWFEKFFNICKEKVNKKIGQEFSRKTRKNEIMADVYSSLPTKVIHSILKGNYKGADTLVAEMDFSDDDYGSKVYFENIGLSENKKIQHKDVKPILEYFDLIDHHKNDKDEL